jgi:hypothetical protein
MFSDNLAELKIHKKEADLLVCGAIRVHLIQHTAENNIGPDDGDSARHEQN